MRVEPAPGVFDPSFKGDDRPAPRDDVAGDTKFTGVDLDGTDELRTRLMGRGRIGRAKGSSALPGPWPCPA